MIWGAPLQARLLFEHAFGVVDQHLRQRAPARPADRGLVALRLHGRPLGAWHGYLPNLRRRVVSASAHR